MFLRSQDKKLNKSEVIPILDQALIELNKYPQEPTKPKPTGDVRMSKYYDSVWRWESFLNKIENLNSEQDEEKLIPLIPEFNRIGENIKNFIIQFETKNSEIINTEKTSELKTMLNRVKKMQEKWTGQQHRIKRVENSVSPTSELSPISTYTVSEYI